MCLTDFSSAGLSWFSLFRAPTKGVTSTDSGADKVPVPERRLWITDQSRENRSDTAAGAQTHKQSNLQHLRRAQRIKPLSQAATGLRWALIIHKCLFIQQKWSSEKSHRGTRLRLSAPPPSAELLAEVLRFHTNVPLTQNRLKRGGGWSHSYRRIKQHVHALTGAAKSEG